MAPNQKVPKPIVVPPKKLKTKLQNKHECFLNLDISHRLETLFKYGIKNTEANLRHILSYCHTEAVCNFYWIHQDAIQCRKLTEQYKCICHIGTDIRGKIISKCSSAKSGTLSAITFGLAENARTWKLLQVSKEAHSYEIHFANSNLVP